MPDFDTEPGMQGQRTHSIRYLTRDKGHVQVLTDSGDDRIALEMSWRYLLLTPAESLRLGLALIAAAFSGWRRRA